MRDELTHGQRGPSSWSQARASEPVVTSAREQPDDTAFLIQLAVRLARLYPLVPGAVIDDTVRHEWRRLAPLLDRPWLRVSVDQACRTQLAEINLTIERHPINS